MIYVGQTEIAVGLASIRLLYSSGNACYFDWSVKTTGGRRKGELVLLWETPDYRRLKAVYLSC